MSSVRINHLYDHARYCVLLFLSPQDVLKAGRAFRWNGTMVQKVIQKALAEIVREHYRAAAECPVKGVTMHPGRPIRTVQALEFFKKPEYYEATDVYVNNEGTLSVQRSWYHPISELEARKKDFSSKTELVSVQGEHFFVNHYVLKIFKKVEEIFKYHFLVVKSLLTQPHGHPRPLQELRDSRRQLQVIETERRMLNEVLQKINCPKELMAFLPPIPTNFRELLKKRVTFTTTEIIYKEEIIPVCISAAFDKELTSSKFLIINISNNAILGVLECKTVWYLDHSSPWEISELQEQATNDIIQGGRITGGKVLFCGNLEDHLGQDEETGDYPVRRLLIQIAVEILVREPRLEELHFYDSKSREAVYFAAGFRDFSPESSTELSTKIAEARKAGKVFPFSKEDPRIILFGLKKATKESARLDFKINSFPITWKQQIESAPLLGGGDEPVLPSFYRRNFPELQRQQLRVNA